MINPDNQLNLAELLPDSMAGWKAEKTVPLKVNTDLYNYMDGGAELYLSYVFDLVESRNAFGVFSQTREDEIQQYGQGTYMIPGALFFWKDHYYITLSAWESSPETNEFINTLAAYIDKQIPETGDIPALVKLMPEQDLVPSGFKYFHHYVWLNSFFFISDQNLLNIDNTTNALLAKYVEGDKRKYLLLVQYADQEAARKAYSAFGGEFFPEGLVDKCIQLEDDTWMAAFQNGNLVAAVFNAASRQSAGQLLNNVINKIN
jgi:hypothetical protein